MIKKAIFPAILLFIVLLFQGCSVKPERNKQYRPLDGVGFNKPVFLRNNAVQWRIAMKPEMLSFQSYIHNTFKQMDKYRNTLLIESNKAPNVKKILPKPKRINSYQAYIHKYY